MTTEQRLYEAQAALEQLITKERELNRELALNIRYQDRARQLVQALKDKQVSETKEEIRLAKIEPRPVMTAEQHNAFPGGRY